MPASSHWNEQQAAAFIQLMLGQTQQFGVVFYDLALRITGWNNGASFLTGWSADEVLGQPTAMLFVPEDRERKLDEHEAYTARVVGVAEDERWHLRKDNSRLWSSGVSLGIKDEQGELTGFIKIFRDATHLRTRMKYLENFQQECHVQQHEKNVFIGTIAHEMRNPLAPLKTAVELLKRLPDDNARLARPLTVMDRQIGFLERLVEDLVDLTRVQAGKMSISYDTVVLQEFLNEAVDNCRAGAERKAVTVYTVIPQVPIGVEVDTRRLLQVLQNLLNNSIKFTPTGGAIWLTATVDQTHFMCNVKDNGKGISADLLPKIFDVFTQADKGGAERGAGLGIGLAVVKEIVSLHQGTVEVRSEGPGRGSEFIVRIPVKRPSGSQPEPMSVQEAERQAVHAVPDHGR